MKTHQRINWTIGIFARANHPQGWGTAQGRAHGYVTLFVRCRDEDELDKVSARVANKLFHGIPKTTFSGRYSEGMLDPGWDGVECNYVWFGGNFELVGVAHEFDWPKERFQCRGDNRMVAHFTSDEVLDG